MNIAPEYTGWWRIPSDPPGSVPRRAAPLSAALNAD